MGDIIAVLTPITSPLILNNGPPELPRLIAASVCIKSSYGPDLSVLFRADIIPADTEKPCPNGFPIAITQSPTRAISLSPKPTNGKGSEASTFNTAISVLGSRPTSFATSSFPSKNSITISSALSITWLLVTIYPSDDTTNPEPRALLLLGLA